MSLQGLYFLESDRNERGTIWYFTEYIDVWGPWCRIDDATTMMTFFHDLDLVRRTRMNLNVSGQYSMLVCTVSCGTWETTPMIAFYWIVVNWTLVPYCTCDLKKFGFCTWLRIFFFEKIDHHHHDHTQLLRMTFLCRTRMKLKV
jgi:hypothetical protein